MRSSVSERSNSISRDNEQSRSSIYNVQSGDNIYSIARHLNISVRSLIIANNLQPPFKVSVGQVLILPNDRNYVVIKDDTLLGIARKIGVPFSTLARINNLSSPYILLIGQKLKLPEVIDSTSAQDSSNNTAISTKEPTIKETTGNYNSLAKREATEVKQEAQEYIKQQNPESSKSEVIDSTSAQDSSRSINNTAISTKEPTIKETTGNYNSLAKREATEVKQQTKNIQTSSDPLGSNGFIWPVHGRLLVEFGTTGKGQHNDGINIAVSRDTPVLAAQDGVIVYSGNELRGFGNLLLIKHSDGWMTAYAHNDALLVKRGDNVRRGQQIAKSGDSGGATQPQLHFEIRQGTRAVDPMIYLMR
ncbi:MAG: LysM peptidoglycan-binding domain-containing M23 family metallopeptidase [Rhodospirillaceae bacterium]|jgi:murein DD-endopeptidase MepM/ murein hydrolase activator NlpD|nr:LysM peptidoglycan-binding domain-containing M23 family metallopeptidase [Rhodospirillaceae bacterium]